MSSLPDAPDALHAGDLPTEALPADALTAGATAEALPAEALTANALHAGDLPAEALTASALTAGATAVPAIADGPPPELYYRHRSAIVPALRSLWARREIIFTLAERDIRASYKQAVLGMGWALLTPVASLIIFTLIFSHVKSFQQKGVPYAIYAYAGILCWSYFSGSLNSGGNSMLANMPLLQKTHFPRECFPLSQMLEQTVYTVIAFLPLGILFAIKGFAPKRGIVWSPIFMLIEVAFAAGVVLALSALVIYARDLVQALGIFTQLGMFATPVIWPFSKVPAFWQPLYALVNPLGPVIDNVRRTMLLGQSPTWSLLAIAAVGAAGYLVVGYLIFKRLEATFADIA